MSSDAASLRASAAAARSRSKAPGITDRRRTRVLLVGVQEVVAPVDRRLERLLSPRVRRRPPVRSAKQSSRRSRIWAGVSAPVRAAGELDRERQPIEAAADVADRRIVSRPELDPPPPWHAARRGGPTPACRCPRRRPVTGRAGSARPRDRAPRDWWRAHVHAGTRARRSSSCAAASSRTCSQLSTTTRTRRAPIRSLTCWATGTSSSGTKSRPAAKAPATPASSPTRERSTKTCRRDCRLARGPRPRSRPGLPAPTPPVRVTGRPWCSRARVRADLVVATQEARALPRGAC